MRVRAGDRGFTLIELIAVMALLTTVMAVVAPSLSRFMRGRALEEEGRRFLALTQYARSEAASRGVVLRLWVSPEEGAYGLAPETRAESEDVRALEYRLADRLRFELPEDVELVEYEAGNRLEVTFWPDGGLDEGAEDEAVRIVDEDGRGLAVVREDYGEGYALEARDGDAS